MSDGFQSPRRLPPIEDLARLQVESRLLPFIISTILRAEQSPNSSPPLSPAEAENLVEVLDKVVSSTTVNPSLKNRCFRVLGNLSPSHGVLPRSYFPPGVILSDTIPYACGGFADIWKGQLDGNQVCVKAFRTQTTVNLDKVKRRLYREIIRWKYVSHPNVQPFLGVSETLFPFCIISPWLPNGNILEYTRGNQREVDRLRLLAQAACGLEYLHSLSIVHGDLNPGNVLITEDGNARLGDFGLTGIITDPTVVEPSITTVPKPGVFRYMAPELLNPPQFNLKNNNPSKESDIYSLVMTAYETLTEILPYGNARDSVIISHIVTGARPPRPPHSRWLQDQIWDMITTCWSEKREERWGVHAVCNQFSTSSRQEILSVEPEPQTTTRSLKAAVNAPPKNLSLLSPPGQVEDRSPLVRQATKNKLLRLGKNYPPTTVPVPSALPPKKHFPVPTPPHTGGDGDESGTDHPAQGKRIQMITTLSRGWDELQAMANALTRFLRLRKSPETDERPSR